MVTYEPFRGDVEELERMAHVSWRDEYKIDSYPNLYKPGYFNYLFGGMEHKDHLIGAYEDGKLIAFMAALPRNFHYKGGIYSAVLACLLVTRKEAYRRGSALGLTAKALELNANHGYDFALLYLETGHRSSKMLAKLKAAGNPVQKVKRMNAVVRALDLNRIFASENVKLYEKIAMKLLRLDKKSAEKNPPQIRNYRPEDLPACMQLLNSYKESATLARVLDERELERELSFPDTAFTIVWEEGGKILGLVNWVLVEHVGKIPQNWAWLNHLYFKDLDDVGRRALIRAFLAEADSQGAAGVVEWAKNYYPKGPLWKNRFIPYPRSVDMLAWVFNKNLNLENIKDVFEVQI